MRRGGLRIAILLGGAALPLLLATTAAVAAPTLPGVPITIPTVTVPTIPTVTVPTTIPTVTVPTTIPAVTVPAIPTVTIPALPTVTVPPLPTVTIPALPTTDVAPTQVGAAGTVSSADPAPSTGGSPTASPGAATGGGPTSSGTETARTTTAHAGPVARRPPTLLTATRQAAAPFALPLALMLLVAAWLVVRGMHDRRDVRLAAAPVADRWMRFR